MFETLRLQKSKFKLSVKRDLIILSCLVLAIIVGVRPAFAGATADLLYTVLGVIITAVASILVGGLEIVLNFLLTAMSVDINQLKSWGMLAGLETFNTVIRALGVGIASVAVLWQLGTILFGPMLDTKQDKSVRVILTRALIFIPLTYAMQSIAFGAFSELQKIYTALLQGYSEGYSNGSGQGLFIQLSDKINMDTFLNDMAASTPTIQPVLVTTGPVFVAMISTILTAGFMVIILWNLLKLVLEIAQRFVIMIVYVYLSPLAAACGVIGHGEIPQKGLALFVSSGILWILNVWCIGISCTLISSVGIGIQHGVAGIFTWGLLTYGFLKVAQQLDDVFNAVGATNVRLRGSILDEVVSMNKSGFSPSAIMGGVGSAYKVIGKVAGAVTGKSPGSPVAPSTMGIRSGNGVSEQSVPTTGAAVPAGTLPAGKPTGAAASTSDTAKAATAESARSAVVAGNAESTRKASDNAVQAPIHGTAQPSARSEQPGKMEGGEKVNGENVGAVAGSAAVAGIATGAMQQFVQGEQESHAQEEESSSVKDLGNALSQQDYEQRAEQLKEMHDKDPDVFNRSDVKDYIGDKQLGLDSDKQTLLDTQYNAATGEMSGVVATAKENGAIALDKVSGLEDTKQGCGNQRPNSAQQFSSVAGQAKVQDFASLPGQQKASFSYTDKSGKQQTGIVERTGNAPQGGGQYRVSTASGKPATVTAPAGMGAMNVARLVNGTAPEAVKAAYAAYQAQTTMAHTSISGTVAAGATVAGTAVNAVGNTKSMSGTAAMESFKNSVQQAGVNMTGGGRVTPGTGENARDNASFVYKNSDGVREVGKMERAGSVGNGIDNFTMTTADGQKTTLAAPAEMTAADVAKMANGTATRATRASYQSSMEPRGASEVSAVQGEAHETYAHLAGQNTSDSAIESVAAQAGIDQAQGGSVRAVSSVVGAGENCATMTYTDNAGDVHTAQVQKAHTDYTTGQTQYEVALDDGRTAVVNAPQGTTAVAVASAIADDSESVGGAEASMPDVNAARAVMDMDPTKGGSVLVGTAFENSPNTSATITAGEMDAPVSLSRVFRGEDSSQSDTWAVTQGGIEVGRISAERDAGAAQVAASFMQSDEYAPIRSETGISERDSASIAFDRSSTPCGPEPMSASMVPNASGPRSNGSVWSSIGEVDFGADGSGREQATINYNASVGDGVYMPATARIVDLGQDVETITRDGAEHTGRVYEISGDHVTGGSAKIVVDKSAGMDGVVAAVVSGGQASANVVGAEDIRNSMGVKTTLGNKEQNEQSASALKSFFAANKHKKKTLNNASNPVDAGKQI